MRPPNELPTQGDAAVARRLLGPLFVFLFLPPLAATGPAAGRRQ
jgi:hypothetical protein